MSNFLKRKKHTENKRNMGEIPPSELSNVATTAIESVLRIADEYGKDRDEVCSLFASVLFKSVLAGTFKYYELEGNEK